MKTSTVRALSLALALSLGVTSTAWASPQVGRPIPVFSVEDLSGTLHTQRDLTGRWTVILAMTDKDSGPAIASWYLRIERLTPPGTRMLTFAALDLFGLIPTATIFSEARSSTPRNRWTEVWLSRNGSLAESLGLPDGEAPWVIVTDPTGRVAEVVHATVDDAGLARVAAAFGRAQRAPSAPTAAR